MTPHDKQVMMFSATLGKAARVVCRKFMQDVNIYKLVFSQLTMSMASTTLVITVIITDETARYNQQLNYTSHHRHQQTARYNLLASKVHIWRNSTSRLTPVFYVLQIDPGILRPVISRISSDRIIYPKERSLLCNCDEAAKCNFEFNPKLAGIEDAILFTLCGSVYTSKQKDNLMIKMPTAVYNILSSRHTDSPTNQFTAVPVLCAMWHGASFRNRSCCKAFHTLPT